MTDFYDHGYLLDIVGAGIVTATPGNQVTLEYTFVEKRLITGASYHRIGNLEDTVTFQVLIGGVVMNQFATDIFLGETGMYQYYKAFIPAGAVIKIIYKNNGALVSKFAINFICHKEKPAV